MENFSEKCCNNFFSWEYVHLWCENDNIFQYECITFVTFCFSYGSKSLEYFVILIQLCIRNLFEVNYEFKKYTGVYTRILFLLDCSDQNVLCLIQPFCIKSRKILNCERQFFIIVPFILHVSVKIKNLREVFFAILSGY